MPPNLQKLKKNNKGFSLVELLVGVAILAFVIGPLLYSFITSAATTRKSHVLGNATLASRNIIETIKAEGVGNVLDDVGTGDPFDSGVFRNDYTSESSYTYRWDEVSGYYRFMLQGVQAGGSTFDVLIAIDATTYKNPNPEEPVEDSHFNDMPITEYSPMDVIHAQPRYDEDPDFLAVDDFFNEVYSEAILANPEGADPIDPDIIRNAIEGNYRRIITLDIAHNITSTGGVVTRDDVTMTVTYTYETFTFNTSYVIYDEKHVVNDDIAVYLLYRPHYSDPRYEDLIIINNEDEAVANLTVFIVKQRPYKRVISVDPLDGTETVTWHQLEDDKLEDNESTYRARIDQRESYANFMARNDTVNNTVKIHTNIRENLSGVSLPIDGHFRHRIVSGWMTAEKQIKDELLVSQVTQDRMFDVRVHIFDVGGVEDGADPLLSFDATKLD